MGTRNRTAFSASTFRQPTRTTCSLAVVLLASVADKQANRYVYASELIVRSPSVALAFAACDGGERFGLREDVRSAAE